MELISREEVIGELELYKVGVKSSTFVEFMDELISLVEDMQIVAYYNDDGKVEKVEY